ncbi:MAG: hypothetical protein KJO50_11715 [Bacteroidia bacterium]|nr:hypothetical protein [Bacteroidia bacterium]MBT8230920.1 hypothetical protein [Bacteroidia bacterium]NNK90634.1 hypothetical protein [Saprospiraceae bacterium]
MRLILTFSLLLTFGSAGAQNNLPGLFIDCQMRCHFNYIKEQITFVNYMQDRQLADIFILATRQRTGAGGDEVQLLFEGNNHFTGMMDTIKYFVDPNATESIERDLLVNEIKRGLLKYIIHTDIINKLDYTVESNTADITETPIHDPWNYWVFNIGGNGWLNGEDTYNSIDLTGRISANRITDKNKIQFSARYNHEENNYTLTDGEEFKSIRKSYNLYFEYVKSLGDHWSVGGISRSGSTTFGNTDLSTTIRGALEFNVYPYSDAQTRRFSFFYTIGPEYYDYTDLTIYDKESEWVGRHGLTIQYEQTQKWGDISISFGVQQYFHDPHLYNAYLNPRLNWQIFKGLSINFGGFFSFVNDRINIAKSDISDEDILLQIKQLDTDFSYYSYFGVNYRFGSKYNNFVNPRF